MKKTLLEPCEDEASVGVECDRLTEDYRRWTGGRTVPSLGTNDGAPPLAFQTWHRFKEAFPPELIATAVTRSKRQVAACVDPFGGSGTTALACQMLGVRSTTIEVNPFLADVIRAKLASFDVDELISTLAQVRRQSKTRSVAATDYFANAPKTFLESPTNSRWLFNLPVADRLAAILSAIDGVEATGIRRLLRVVVGGMLAEVSNVTVSGKGRRYRGGWKDSATDADAVDRLFASRAERALTDIGQFRQRHLVDADVIEGDARKVQLKGAYDLSVFSPPYPNSFDYTDVYNLELWMLGYLTKRDDNRHLRNATLSSHVQLLREYSPPPVGSPTLDTVLERLNGAQGELWSPWIPHMIGSYFSDLMTVVDRLRPRLRDDAQCWIVVGDSRYKGVTVPVAKILTELVQERHWTVQHSAPIRHMKSSAQQGGRPELAESLIVLRAD
ncbi:DNA methyltransferase [Micromonospora parva]|uniref:DNA methyltransferase n=1 Tax=Micromonospora parva TaxID=1464048 RepID=UPI0033FFF326